MANIRVSDKQSILDVAIQLLGSVEAAFSLALLNGLSITDELYPGQLLILPTAYNADIANYYADRGIVTATAITTSTEEQASIFDETYETFE